MKLTIQLAHIQKACASIDAVESAGEILKMVSLGTPFDIFFFQNLSDPAWIPELATHGYFDTLPTTETKSDGTVIYARSLPLRGLSNLAAKAPSEVLRILESLTISENPSVKDQLMGILAAINDPNLTERVLRMAEKVLRVKPFTNIVWIDDILSNALRSGALNPTLHLVDALLDVTLSATASQPRTVDAWQIGEIDRNVLAPVSVAIPLPVAGVVFSTFVKWVQIQRGQDLNPENDSFEALLDLPPLPEDAIPSAYWLEDFHGSAIGFHEFESILANRLFEIGTMIHRNNKPDEMLEFDNLLRSNSWILFARLRWQLYADSPESSLGSARRDAIARIPNLGHYAGSHGYEMAQMLEIHSKMYGDAFLTPKDVESFCTAVRTGPIDHDGNLVTESTYPETFYRTQLYPIRSLLKNGDLDFFNSLFEDTPEIRPEAFKPFSSGGAKVVENVPPIKALEMLTMPDAELWDFLNNWVPNPKCPDPEKWWLEEDVSALGIKFAELLELTPDRFPASAEWWKNLTRRSVLVKPLDRAATRIADATKNGTETSAAPTENDWQNWFGLASWITSQRTVSPVDKEDIEGGVRPEDQDWNWPRIVVVKFLTAALGSKFEFPTDLVAECGRLIRKLIEDPDERLGEKDKPWMDDWVTTAINSVRGTAVEGLFELALFHKRRCGNPDPEGWIFDLILSRLKLPNESQAVFAIFGCRLRLLLHFFGEKFKSQPELLLPSDRKEHRNTLLLSHFRFDNPNKLVIKTLPMLADAGIECLAEMIGLGQDDKQTRGDFGSRLGTHLGFYYWNKLFSNQETADAILDRYFATAKPSQRGSFIRQIARIFSESPDKENLHQLHEMLRKLWDRRFAKIEQELAAKSITPQDVHSELSAFIDWLAIEGLPFDWRHDQILRAIKFLQKAPVAGFTIKTLEKISSQPERLHASLEILKALMSKDSQELRWNYQAEYLKPILLRGIKSENAATKKLGEESREILLRQGQFEYLDLGSE